MATFNLNGYNSYSGCDIVVTARLNTISGGNGDGKEKVYTLGSLQTLSISTHQDKKSVRVIGSVNALDYTMGQRTIAGSLVFAVFDQHFATEMFNDLEKITGKTFFLPDELPAIDLTVTFANEYGRTSRMAIYGVRIINEGQVMSINDLYTENTYQFVANALEPLKKGTHAGSSSNKTREVQVASAFDFNDLNIQNTGENIYSKSIGDNNSSLSRVLLSVEVDQPKYEDQEGIARISLSPIQSTGVIVIHNQLQDKVEEEIFISNSNTSIYNALLKQGLYTAWYENNGQILSNTVVFSIDKIGNYNTNYDDSPIIEDVKEDSIQILSNNTAHTVGVCINTNTNKHIEKELISKKCTFNNLDPNTTYALYTKHENSNSKSVQCKTLSEEENYINGFRSYVNYNSSLLSVDLNNYESILDKLNDNQEIIYTLSKEKSERANELIYMAVKYKNEFNRIINNHKLSSIPTKDLENIFGNTIKFSTDALKYNIFSVKNKKEYFVHSEEYPTEVTYTDGKANTLYNVISISNDNIKSPKYTFYNYAENDKSNIEKLFGKANQLAHIDLTDYAARNPKKSEDVLKCLAVLDNKNIDLKLLKAPQVSIDKEDNMVFDVDYRDCIGIHDKKYYICISNIEESLDNTSFRKLLITDKDEVVFANKYMTAANHKDILAVWIEDENFNVVSEITFTSTLEDINNFNEEQVEKAISNIISQIDLLAIKNNTFDIMQYLSSSDVCIKNIYYEIAKAFIEMNISELNTSLLELFKIKFEDYYINQDKFKKVYYNRQKKNIKFDTSNKNTQLINIKFKRNHDYVIEVIDDLSITLDNEYDYNLLYLIDSNPMIKSGFVFINSNGQIMSHSIAIEEVE